MEESYGQTIPKEGTSQMLYKNHIFNPNQLTYIDRIFTLTKMLSHSDIKSRIGVINFVYQERRNLENYHEEMEESYGQTIPKEGTSQMLYKNHIFNPNQLTYIDRIFTLTKMLSHSDIKSRIGVINFVYHIKETSMMKIEEVLKKWEKSEPDSIIDMINAYKEIIRYEFISNPLSLDIINNIRKNFKGRYVDNKIEGIEVFIGDQIDRNYSLKEKKEIIILAGIAETMQLDKLNYTFTKNRFGIDEKILLDSIPSILKLLDRSHELYLIHRDEINIFICEQTIVPIDLKNEVYVEYLKKNTAKIKDKGLREAMYQHYKYLEAGELCWYIEIADSQINIFSIVLDRQPLIENIIKKYNANMDRLNEDDSFDRIIIREMQLDMILQLVSDLERIHPYADFNCRTFCVLVLNRELIKNHFQPCFMNDPNVFDYMTIESLREQYRIGVDNYRILIDKLEEVGDEPAHNIPYNNTTNESLLTGCINNEQ
eukprot:TRINITY_DN19188_c0_g1_i2.p1 TRINITY_DN19188_c0_g1~~TRINITY_DN19188_c0_g1_i2.p1  ORF type:complete len:503 (+),score=-96.28 TRINITY_DN19188_c0_g1_i2:58-1509(+)